jgi:hypothetical protein
MNALVSCHPSLVLPFSMPRSHSVEAIVLRTIDVGEADRFCILFTRELGRKAARARGVRKPMSRFGGLLLPFRLLRIELSESDHSCAITSAMHIGDRVLSSPDMTAFVRWERGVELLLALTEEDEPLPGVFDLLFAFLQLSSSPDSPLLPFQLRLFALLGLLPTNDDDRRYARLSEQGKLFLRACAEIMDLSVLTHLPVPEQELQDFLEALFQEYLSRPLKSGNVVFDF